MLAAGALISVTRAAADNDKPPPIPKAGALGATRSLDQVGLPIPATQAAIPADNPQTPERIELGKQLFFDGRLSADGTVACSTCHDPARAFTDGRPVSIGIKGRAGQRNAPTILHALYNKTQFWDGRATTLEDQAALPIVNPEEMGQPNLDAAVARIMSIATYDRRLRSVFGRLPNGPDLVRAIASYERKFHSIRYSIPSSRATRTLSMKVRSVDASRSTRVAAVTNATRSTRTRGPPHSLSTRIFRTSASASASASSAITSLR
jgi:cytochrome c peroxidase